MIGNQIICLPNFLSSCNRVTMGNLVKQNHCQLQVEEGRGLAMGIVLKYSINQTLPKEDVGSVLRAVQQVTVTQQWNCQEQMEVHCVTMEYFLLTNKPFTPKALIIPDFQTLMYICYCMAEDFFTEDNVKLTTQQALYCQHISGEATRQISMLNY